jgi:hypothetical protein
MQQITAEERVVLKELLEISDLRNLMNDGNRLEGYRLMIQTERNFDGVDMDSKGIPKTDKSGEIIREVTLKSSPVVIESVAKYILSKDDFTVSKIRKALITKNINNFTVSDIMCIFLKKIFIEIYGKYP